MTHRTATEPAEFVQWLRAEAGHSLPGVSEADVGELLTTNRMLWHLEDTARRVGASDREVADAKRTIDSLNHRRNHLVEHIDECLEHAILQDMRAEQHSETPGMIIDRLSISVIRMAAMHHRLTDTSQDHAVLVRQHAVVTRQADELRAAFWRLMHDIIAGRRRFTTYRQFK